MRYSELNLIYKQPYRVRWQKFPQGMAGSISFLKTFFQLMRTKSNSLWAKSYGNFKTSKNHCTLMGTNLYIYIKPKPAK
jgi:hypothetical protein